MFDSAWQPRFRTRLRRFALPAEAPRVERVLANARVVLAVSALVAVYLDPTEPTHYAAFAYGLLVAYVILSLAILVVLRKPSRPSPAFPLLVHGTDVVWATAITLLTEGPSSPFFVFFVFVLLAAAYRWGFPETLGTAGLAVLLLFYQVLLIHPAGLGLFLASEPLELNRLIMRATYLLLMGFLLGFLAEEEKQLRAETATVARLVARARVEVGLRGSLQAVLSELLQLFDAPRALLAVQEASTSRTFLWDAQRAAPPSTCTLNLSEADKAQRQALLFGTPEASGRILRQPQPAPSPNRETCALDALLPEGFRALFPFRSSLLMIPFEFGQEWTGRLFLFDAPLKDAEAELHFLQSLLRQISPALYNVQLLRRLRARAGAMERARVARELHDGAIQSLLAIELQLEALRRQAADGTASIAAELARLQKLLRQEVVNLRELMQQLSPPGLGPRQLLDFMADTVEKFRRETGIGAQFVSNVEEVALPPRVCRELARILQEALVNVRKHSGARNVLVRFVSRDGGWLLVVDDDGRGFDFSGRLSHAELDAARKGPLVIKERARSIDAELTVESSPGHGARLEIVLPERSHG